MRDSDSRLVERGAFACDKDHVRTENVTLAAHEVFYSVILSMRYKYYVVVVTVVVAGGLAGIVGGAMQ